LQIRHRRFDSDRSLFLFFRPCESAVKAGNADKKTPGPRGPTGFVV
jgi:hypothetical protein